MDWAPHSPLHIPLADHSSFSEAVASFQKLARAGGGLSEGETSLHDCLTAFTSPETLDGQSW